MIRKIECVSCTPSDPNCPTCGQTGTDGQYEVLSGLKLTDHNGVVYYVRALYAVLVNTTAQSISIVQNGLTVYEIRLNDTTYNTLQELAAAACACNGSATSGSGSADPEEITIADGDTATIEAKRWLLGIGFAPDASARTISVGTTIGGTEILDTEPIPANSSHGVGLGMYFHQSTVIHFSGFAGDIRLILI